MGLQCGRPPCSPPSRALFPAPLIPPGRADRAPRSRPALPAAVCPACRGPGSRRPVQARALRRGAMAARDADRPPPCRRSPRGGAAEPRQAAARAAGQRARTPAPPRPLPEATRIMGRISPSGPAALPSPASAAAQGPRARPRRRRVPVSPARPGPARPGPASRAEGARRCRVWCGPGPYPTLLSEPPPDLPEPPPKLSEPPPDISEPPHPSGASRACACGSRGGASAPPQKSRGVCARVCVSASTLWGEGQASDLLRGEESEGAGAKGRGGGEETGLRALCVRPSGSESGRRDRPPATPRPPAGVLCVRKPRRRLRGNLGVCVGGWGCVHIMAAPKCPWRRK